MVTIIKKGTPKEQIKKQIDEVVSKTAQKNIKKFAGALKIDFDSLQY